MSFLTDTDVNWKANNLFVALEQATSFPNGILLRSDLADMQYSASYLAFAPLATAIGGTWDPARTGANIALSQGDMLATFSGAGSTAGTVNSGTHTMCEYLIGQFVSVGFFIAGLAPPYDANAFGGGSVIGGQQAFATFYVYDGTLYSFAGGSLGNPQFTQGSVVGSVFNNTTGQCGIFIDGVLVASGGTSNNDMRPMATSQ